MIKSCMRVASLLVAAGVAVAPLMTAIARQSAAPAKIDVALLANVLQLVRRAYVYPVSSDELTRDALKGMLTRLDPHSDYMDAQEFKQSEADMGGSFGGIGMELSEQNGVPKVISPIDGTPAAHAGLEPGDEIVLINRSSTKRVNLSKVVNLLRGPPGTTVTITILPRQAGALRYHAYARDHRGQIN